MSLKGKEKRVSHERCLLLDGCLHGRGVHTLSVIALGWIQPCPRFLCSPSTLRDCRVDKAKELPQGGRRMRPLLGDRDRLHPPHKLSRVHFNRGTGGTGVGVNGVLAPK